LSTEGSSFDTLLAVWTNLPGAPNLVACQDNVWDNIWGKEVQSRLTLAATANTTYYIQVGGRNNAAGLLRFRAYPPLNNDAIGNAKLIAAVPYGDAVNTEQTTQNGGDPVATNCSFYFINNPTPWHTVWYRYTPAQDEKVVFNTFGSSFNTLLSLWKGQPGSLTQVACHDDAALVPTGSDNVNDMTSFIQTTLVKGETYYLLAGGKDAFFTNIPRGELKVDVQRWYLDPTLPTPSPTAPPNGAAILDLPPTLAWSAVAGASAYDLQIGTTNPPATTVIRVNGTSYKLSALQPKTYYWRVRAVAGLPTSAWSNVQQFTFSLTPSGPNDVPARNLFTTATPTLTWTRVSWATAYEVVVAQNSQFTNPVYANTNVKGLEATLSPLAPGAYFWRVRAKRADGTFGAWSAADSFVIIVS
jgi:hypothetical protein